MKPLRLEFCGINSFSTPAVIDFASLLSGGIFGIFGDTGAGKSTILDSIGFALYGRVNRVGKDGTSMADIVNYDCKKAQVAFEFEIEYQGVRNIYRIERELSKKNATQKAVLFHKEGDSFITVADGAKAVNTKVEDEIVGISFDDFKKCIALPQGEFSQFLRATRSERLALIAKLFSFEKYGYPLAQKAKGRLNEKKQGVAEIESKLETYQDVSAEIIATMQTDLAHKSSTLEQKELAERECKKTLDGLEECVKNQNDLQKTRQELTALQSQSAQMQEKSQAVEKLRVAQEIIELSHKLEEKQGEYAQRQAKVNGYALQTETLAVQLQDKERQLAEAKTDGRLQSKQKDLARVVAAKADVQSCSDAEKRLNDARSGYKRQSEGMKKYVGFDYEGEKAVLEGKMSLLPKEDNVNDFILNNLKEVMLAKEYEQFAVELIILTQKYPVIAPDSQPLIDRYSLKTGERVLDIDAQIKGFSLANKQKTEIQKKLLDLDKKQSEYELDCKKLQDLEAEGRRLLEEYTAKKTALAEVEKLGSEAELERAIDAIQKSQDDLQKSCDGIKAQQATNEKEHAANKAAMEELSKVIQESKDKLTKLQIESDIENVDKARELLSRYGGADALKKEVDNYYIQLGVKKQEETRLTELVKGVTVDEQTLTAEREKHESLKREITALTGEVAVLKAGVERANNRLKEKQALENQSAAQMQEVALLEKVVALVKDNKFMEFVAVEYLQEMASNANNLLLNLTNGRYFLVYDKNFAVGDNFNGGELRGVHTLSGGETFLVSLSLALSLSAAIHQKSLRPIEFFFLDEGFGSLDNELVDTVMDSLEKLKSDNFSIGIISHVGELKDRLENKISVVKADGEHGSLILA